MEVKHRVSEFRAQKVRDEQGRDPDGKFASSPGGKTAYTHTSASTNVSKLNAANKEIRGKAHEHANYLKEKGHEGVKVTKNYKAHTIPGKGIGGTKTYTVHHGQPKSNAQES